MKEESEPDEAKAPSSSVILGPAQVTMGEGPQVWGGKEDTGLVRAGVHLHRRRPKPLGEVVLLLASRPCWNPGTVKSSICCFHPGEVPLSSQGLALTKMSGVCKEEAEKPGM